MKKILLPLFFLISCVSAKAQVCVPGTLTAPKNAYILPDSATNFANACPGTYYEQILYIKAAKDTAIVTSAGIITADIDSFVVDADIIGLPASWNPTVESVPAALPAAGASAPKSNMLRLVIPGDSLACVRISGNIPANEPAATIPLTVNLRVYTSNLHSTTLLLELGIPTLYPGRKTDTLTSINDYRIVVYPTPCWPTAVNTISQSDFDLVGNMPNPSKDQTNIVFESRVASSYTLSIKSAIGENILSKKSTPPKA
ncbi:hypothetical protein EMGBS15_03090 [Filimonas sp.]|nr:hypothetical protein EMGBS15_03090 [Filimonas sp.]